MRKYLSELWIGQLDSGGYNYKVKGVPPDDYQEKIMVCQEMMERLKQIIEFYQGIDERESKT